MKHILSILVALIYTTSLWAYDCKIDGIYYNLNDSDLTATVTNEIGDYSAKSYSESVTIPSTIAYKSKTYSVITIGEWTFSNCSGLISITIPNSVTTIEDYAFWNCSGLTSVTIPNSVIMIGYDAFDRCTSLPIIGSLRYAGAYLIEAVDKTLSTYTIKEETKWIGSAAFSNCSGLTSITIPNSVTSIGEQAFIGCRGLTSVSIGNSVTTIEDYAFCHCSSLTSVTIPNSVTTIGKEAFSFCEKLTSATIPNSVITIGEMAFSECSSLAMIEVNAANTHYCSIDGVLFNYTKDTLIQYPIGNTRTKYIIPNSVITIGDHAFCHCSSLTSVTIPNSVTTIEDYAFTYCDNLTLTTIPNSITTIGDGAFAACNGLTSIDVDAANTHYCSIDGVLFNYTKDTLIQYPTGNTGTQYIISNSVIAIENYAFSNCCYLTSITIPKSVITIGLANFTNCSKLTSITCYAVTPPECGSDDVFYNISQDAKVYVLASALVDYQNAYIWKDLQLFPIGADETPIEGDKPIVTPTDNTVTITWPITDGTDTYTLTITKNGETVCVLTFNANGQLTNIAFAAPGHNDAHQAPAATLTAQGYQFTVTGLNPGTTYDYSVTATDAGGKTLAEHKGNFCTTGGESNLQNVRNGAKAFKYFHNGNLIIERNGIKYTPTGQKVR